MSKTILGFVFEVEEELNEDVLEVLKSKLTTTLIDALPPEFVKYSHREQNIPMGKYDARKTIRRVNDFVGK